MNLYTYLEKTTGIVLRKEQKTWFHKLEEKVKASIQLYQAADESTRHRLHADFRNRVRTEEIKAWYSAPEGDSLFQGTSISSLTIPYERKSPLNLQSVVELEENVADAYIELHNKYARKVKNAIIENVNEWLNNGLYYGVVLSSKIISQAFGLSVRSEEVIFKVGNYLVDPHEIVSYPDDVRYAYFEKCVERIKVFEDLKLNQKELESSLILADISKPKIAKYKNRIILAPVRCNEIAAILAERVTKRIIEKTSGKIRPKGLTVVIYDTDSPHTYHQIMGHYRDGFSPVLPGLIILGSSGTIDAFRWLYAYRVSLIAQKMMKGSLYSEAHRRFIPFVFFGVLVPRDAEILLDMENLHRLRYKGNFDPDVEFAYLRYSYLNGRKSSSLDFSWEDFRKKRLT